MSNVTFADLGLAEPLLRALEAANYTVPTPIQARTIPALLQGRDVLGIAQTGTGKTAAFALPVLQHLSGFRERPQPKSPRCLVLAPTRELAVQISRSFDTYGRGLGLRLCTVVGGLGYGRQIESLSRGIDILVATPGRLLDLVERGNVKLSNVTFLVLDEADRMFDMGFIKDVRRIIGSVSKQRQTLMFSATMPGDIAKLAQEILKNPEKVEIAPQGRTVDKIDQRVYFVSAATKRALLGHLLADDTLERVIVFTRTKRGANRVAEALEDRGVRSEAIHGNKSQNARQKALDNFSRGKARVLVATDLASRGIDVTGVTHVINYELPADAESYVHRIGRTARAGASGIAISFCDGSERGQLKSIERLTNQRIPIVATPANEDMPATPPARPRTERDERDERDERPHGHRGAGRGGAPGRGGQGRGGQGRGGPAGQRAFGDRSRGDRPPAPAEHQWSRGDYRDQPRGDHRDAPRGDYRDAPRGDYRDAPRSDYRDAPRGDHRAAPRDDRARDDRPRSGPAHGEHPAGGRPHGNRPYTPRPQGDRPFGGPPRGNGGRRFGGGGGGRGRGRAA
ncbi:DEAD/DEAH box helicase [Reyranella sp.]|uniref:DEAD/DEAH box helicase n=1 Tax=Reyranella sp. TaxID=1929291 RepID=UPI003BABADBF